MGDFLAVWGRGDQRWGRGCYSWRNIWSIMQFVHDPTDFLWSFTKSRCRYVAVWSAEPGEKVAGGHGVGSVCEIWPFLYPGDTGPSIHKVRLIAHIQGEKPVMWRASLMPDCLHRHPAHRSATGHTMVSLLQCTDADIQQWGYNVLWANRPHRSAYSWPMSLYPLHYWHGAWWQHRRGTQPALIHCHSGLMNKVHPYAPGKVLLGMTAAR